MPHVSVVPRDQLEAETMKYARACARNRPTDTIAMQKTFFEVYKQDQGEYKGSIIAAWLESMLGQVKDEDQLALGDETFDRIAPQIDAVLSGSPVQFEFTFRGPEQKDADLSAQLVPRKDVLGRVDGYYLLITDITALKEVERMKSAFVATVSHELRSPLASARTQLEVGLAYPDGTDWPDTAREVLVDVERLQRINHTLSLIPEHSRAQSTLRPVELLVIAPSQRLDDIAARHIHRLPKSVQMLLRSTGVRAGQVQGAAGSRGTVVELARRLARGLHQVRRLVHHHGRIARPGGNHLLAAAEGLLHHHGPAGDHQQPDPLHAHQRLRRLDAGLGEGADEVARASGRGDGLVHPDQTMPLSCMRRMSASESFSRSRSTWSRMPPCCFTPRGSPLTTTGIATRMTLSIATR